MRQAIQGLEITALSHDGAGIGFLPGQGRGKAVFVPGALPGQTVDCGILADKGSFCRAALAGVRSSSRPAAPPHCPHHQECGGCPLQQMQYQDQLFWKEKNAREALGRLGGAQREEIDRLWTPALASPLLAGFRNKAELAFGPDGLGGLALGFRKRGSHAVFNLAGCALLPPEALEIASRFRELAAETTLPPFDGSVGFWRFLILRQTFAESGTPVWVAICVASEGGADANRQVAECGRAALKALPQMVGFIHETRNARDFLAIGRKRVLCLDASGTENPAAACLRLPLDGKFLKLDASSFFQVNGGAASLLARTALAMARGATAKDGLTDLYCGAGAPGLLLAEALRMASYAGVDADAKALEFGRRNAQSLGLGNARFIHASDSRPPKSLPKAGLILADPPRSGLSPKLAAFAAASGAERIVYISCNPATLARDMARLAPAYRLEALAAVDMFPHTPHLECVCLLQRR